MNCRNFIVNMKFRLNSMNNRKWRKNIGYFRQIEIIPRSSIVIIWCTCSSITDGTSKVLTLDNLIVPLFKNGVFVITIVWARSLTKMKYTRVWVGVGQWIDMIVYNNSDCFVIGDQRYNFICDICCLNCNRKYS